MASLAGGQGAARQDTDAWCRKSCDQPRRASAVGRRSHPSLYRDCRSRECNCRHGFLAAAFTPSLPGLSCALLSKERNSLRRTSGGAKFSGWASQSASATSSAGGFAGGVLLGLSRSAALKELVEMVRPPSDFCLESRP